ncbi:unnamed protein product [Brassicogethes aeneus]|uniref:Glycosyl transferase CAP10 domain-containing protein n=1 Tax=Brassicogethes aeneus TaxID=1431903 RepID=A0A9P0B634_BRAAE|nr:unnamed protein product [Brassicogethes aeneus]
MKLLNFVAFLLCLISKLVISEEVSPEFTKVWGPGLLPDLIVMPARYFFIQAVDIKNETIEESLPEGFNVKIEGLTELNKPCRIWVNNLDRKDGSYIIRYKMYEPCINMNIIIKYKDKHVSESPYLIKNKVYSDDCNCPLKNVDNFIENWECEDLPYFMSNKISNFGDIDWDTTRDKLIQKFNQPLAVSICQYIIKNNEIYRKCYGKYVGFSMFMDSILKSLVRKVKLPDLEFFVNLGDWPLSSFDFPEKYPILSWCGSKSSYDIVMPTYDITESSLENMGRVMLDMLSVQGNTLEKFENRIPKLFWRGRDSNRHRLDLILMSREHPELFNASLTNFFFYRDEEHIYGPKTEHVSFFRFFDYKYQIAIDGTVASYRLPYLLAGGSLLFKQDSMYHEHFYHQLEPNYHYVPVKKDLSNLLEKLKWAMENEEKALKIAKNGQKFANENLLPHNIFCYYINLLKELKEVTKSPVRIFEGMERVNQTKTQDCKCTDNIKDEL